MYKIFSAYICANPVTKISQNQRSEHSRVIIGKSIIGNEEQEQGPK